MIISLKVLIFILFFFFGRVTFHLYNPSKSECVEYESIKLPKVKYLDKCPHTWTPKRGCI